MDQEQTDQGSMINTFIYASIESAPQPKIYIPSIKTDIIAQFHTLIVIPFGMGKTSKTKEMWSHYSIQDYTLAAMLGTINEAGELINSALINCANKVLVIDEGHRLYGKARDALLNLLSHGTYERSLGRNIKSDIKIKGSELSGFKIKINKSKNGFYIFARFSCVFFCETIRDKFDYAFISRFCPIILQTDLEDAFKFLKGKSLLGEKLIKRDFEITKETMVCPEFVYEEFIDKYYSVITKSKFIFEKNTHGFIVRNALNLVKLAAHFARLDKRCIIEKKDLDRVIPYIGPTLRAIQRVSLTPNQLQVLQLVMKNWKVKEIATALNISHSSVHHIITALNTKKIILYDPETLQADILTEIQQPGLKTLDGENDE